MRTSPTAKKSPSRRGSTTDHKRIQATLENLEAVRRAAALVMGARHDNHGALSVGK